MTDLKKLEAYLEEAWEDGFFYNLRSGFFNEQQYREIKTRFISIKPLYEEEDVISRRLVSLIWFIPLFISWQEERLLKNKVSEGIIEEMGSFFFDQCERILGIP